MIHVGNRYPARLFRGDRRIHLLCKGGRPIYVSNEAAKAGAKAWLDANVTHRVVMVDDSNGYWFDLEVILPPDFAGNPTDGWSNGTIHLGMFWSDDLVSWNAAGDGWAFSPGKETPETMANGWKKWFVRCISVPVWWKSMLIDLTAVSNRYGKAITGLTIYRTPVSLPNYPYDMPGEAAQLQTDLRAAGYAGATVSSVSAPLTVQVRNHTSNGAAVLAVTQSGTNVTAVADNGVTIALPGYPYSMPGQRATLQTALRNAGKSGAVVMLFGDEWTIFLPNRTATGNVRDFAVTFTPGDPFPTWDMFGNYQGEALANVVNGASLNVRTPTGAPLLEAMKAFARIGFINIPTLP
jgi:hypothetical protein